jgi:hypothetical protein
MSRDKRKFAGPPVRELRQVDKDPVKVPPHKKPRKYRLTLKYVAFTEWTYTKEFVSKEAMREHRARLDRHLAEANSGRKNRWSMPLQYNLKMECEERTTFKEGPSITEEMIEGPL